MEKLHTHHSPMILSMWNSEIKKDNIARAAVRAMRSAREERAKKLSWLKTKAPAKHVNQLVMEYMQKQDEEEVNGALT